MISSEKKYFKTEVLNLQYMDISVFTVIGRYR